MQALQRLDGLGDVSITTVPEGSVTAGNSGGGGMNGGPFGDSPFKMASSSIPSRTSGGLAVDAQNGTSHMHSWLSGDAIFSQGFESSYGASSHCHGNVNPAMAVQQSMKKDGYCMCYRVTID